MTLLYLVRHGDTFEAGEAPRRIGRRTDLPLTRSGRQQAETLAVHLADIPFARAWSGRLSRTRETATQILARQPLPLALEVKQALDEIDHGPDEGATEAAVLARIGTTALDAWNSRLDPPSGWDLGMDWRREAWRAIAKELGEADPALPVLAVTSNGAAQLALQALGAFYPPSTKLRTGSYGVVRIERNTVDICEWDRRPGESGPPEGMGR